MKLLIAIIVKKDGDLTKCINSCVNKNTDMLIVAPDPADEEIKSIEKTGIPSIFHRESKNSKNIAIEHCLKNSYDYIYFIYSNQWLESEGVLNQLFNFVKDIDYDIVGAYSDYNVYYSISGKPEFHTREYLESYEKEKLILRPANIGNLLLNLSKLKEVRYSDFEEFDYEFAIKINGILAHCPIPVFNTYYSTLDPNSINKIREQYVNLYL